MDALADAKIDGLVMLFVENYDYLRPLSEELDDDFVASIIDIAEEGRHLRQQKMCPVFLSQLTKRESEIVLLIAKHLSNREI